MWAICESKCKLARQCGRHQIHAPDPRIRNQIVQKFEPKFGTDCYGFIELNNHQIEDEHGNK